MNSLSKILILSSFFIYFEANAQIKDSSLFSAKEFENWAMVELQKSIYSKDTSSQIPSIVLAKLEQGYYITDETILKAIYLRGICDDIKNTSENIPRKIKYTKTINYINTILKILYKRELLEAKLLDEKSFYIETRGGKTLEDKNAMISLYEKSVPILQKYNNDVLEQMGQHMIKLGDLLLAKRLTKEAENAYQYMSGYTFYQVKAPNDQYQNIRSLHVQACRGILECRRGNLKGLQQLYFYPAIEGELAHKIKEYIEEMGGTYDKYKF